MESCDEHILNIDKAQILKNQNIPSKLYKYRPINKFSINNLQKDTVWLNCPNDYNDPYEFYEHIDFEAINREITKKHLEELLERMTSKIQISQEIIDKAKESDKPIEMIGKALMKENQYTDLKIETFFDFISDYTAKNNQRLISERLEFIQESMKVSSFCEENSQFLMWSHYADSHRGFCIEYDIDKWNKSDLRRRILFPIIYQEEVYDSTPHLIKFINQTEWNNLYPLLSGSTKSKNWEYEKEWRFIINIGTSFQRQNYPMDCQSKVFLGYKISETHKKEIVEICKNKNLSVFQTKLIGNYKLDFEEI
jgi:hypothetical protein